MGLEHKRYMTGTRLGMERCTKISVIESSFGHWVCKSKQNFCMLQAASSKDSQGDGYSMLTLPTPNLEPLRLTKSSDGLMAVKSTPLVEAPTQVLSERFRIPPRFVSRLSHLLVCLYKRKWVRIVWWSTWRWRCCQCRATIFKVVEDMFSHSSKERQIRFQSQRIIQIESLGC